MTCNHQLVKDRATVIDIIAHKQNIIAAEAESDLKQRLTNELRMDYRILLELDDELKKRQGVIT